MILRTINRTPFLKRTISPFHQKWIKAKVAQFSDFISSDHKILDLGSGNCLVTQYLIEKGYNVVPIDVCDLSVIENIRPFVYDGITLPFVADSFDSVLLLTVLHHTDDPTKVITESKRVAKQIIIIEDTYRNQLQKIATQSVDLLVNLGHSKMTYQNKSEKDWEDLFEELELRIVSKRRKRTLVFFRQTTYQLEK